VSKPGGLAKSIKINMGKNTLGELTNIQDELAQRDRKHRDKCTGVNKQHPEGGGDNHKDR
jgi:hypothetical protein